MSLKDYLSSQGSSPDTTSSDSTSGSLSSFLQSGTARPYTPPVPPPSLGQKISNLGHTIFNSIKPAASGLAHFISQGPSNVDYAKKAAQGIANTVIPGIQKNVVEPFAVPLVNAAYQAGRYISDVPELLGASGVQNSLTSQQDQRANTIKTITDHALQYPQGDPRRTFELKTASQMGGQPTPDVGQYMSAAKKTWGQLGGQALTTFLLAAPYAEVGGAALGSKLALPSKITQLPGFRSIPVTAQPYVLAALNRSVQAGTFGGLFGFGGGLASGESMKDAVKSGLRSIPLSIAMGLATLPFENITTQSGTKQVPVRQDLLGGEGSPQPGAVAWQPTGEPNVFIKHVLRDDGMVDVSAVRVDPSLADRLRMAVTDKFQQPTPIPADVSQPGVSTPPQINSPLQFQGKPVDVDPRLQQFAQGKTIEVGNLQNVKGTHLNAMAQLEGDKIIVSPEVFADPQMAQVQLNYYVNHELGHALWNDKIAGTPLETQVNNIYHQTEQGISPQAKAQFAIEFHNPEEAFVRTLGGKNLSPALTSLVDQVVSAPSAAPTGVPGPTLPTQQPMVPVVARPSPGKIEQVKPAATPAPDMPAPTVEPTVAAGTDLRPSTPQFPGQDVAPQVQPVASAPIVRPAPTSPAPVAQPPVQAPAPVPTPAPRQALTESAPPISTPVTPAVAPSASAIATPTAPKEFFAFNRGSGDFVPVKAQPVTNVPELKNLDAFIHRNIDKTSSSEPNTHFVVTEGKSGAVLGRGLTKSLAITSATKNVQARQADIPSLLSSHMSQFGISPRYTKTPEAGIKLSKGELARIVRDYPEPKLQQKIAEELLKQKQTEAEQVNKLQQHVERKPLIEQRVVKPSTRVVAKAEKPIVPKKFSTADEARNKLIEDVKSVGKRTGVNQKEVNSAVNKLSQVSDSAIHELNDIIRVRHSIEPSARREGQHAGYLDTINRQLAIGKREFTPTLVHELSHLGFNKLPVETQSAITNEFNALSPKEQAAAIGSDRLLKYYQDNGNNMGSEYFARQSERIYNGEKINASSRLLKAIRAFFRWLTEKLKGLKPVSDRVASAYKDIFSRQSKLDGELTAEISHKALEPISDEGTLQGSFQDKSQDVALNKIDIPAGDLFSSAHDLNAEGAVAREGFKPEKMTGDIVLSKVGDRYRVISGAGALRGLERRMAKGQSVPETISAIVKGEPATNINDHAWDHVNPSELRNEGMNNEEISALNELSQSAQDVTDNLVKSGNQEPFIRRFLMGGPAVKVMAPHQEFPKEFEHLYIKGHIPYEKYTSAALQDLAKVFKDFKIKPKSEEARIALAYRNKSLSQEQLAKVTPNIVAFNKALTVFTDKMLDELVQSGKIEQGRRVEDYFPLYFKDQKLQVNQRLAADSDSLPGFLHQRKGQPWEVSPKVGLLDGLSAYVRGVYKEIYLRPALKETLAMAKEHYEGSYRLDRATRWLEYVRNPFYVEGDATYRGIVQGARNVSTVLTRLGSAGTLGVYSDVKNAMFGLQWTYAYTGNHMFRAIKMLTGSNRQAALDILKRDAPNLVSEALPLIYGEVGSPATQAIKKFGNIQKALPTTALYAVTEGALRPIAYLAAHLHGQALGLTPEETFAHAHMTVVKTQQIYSNIDTPEMFRGAGGRVLGQFIMPKFKAMYELLLQVGAKNWGIVGRWILAGVIAGTLLNLIIPKKRLMTAAGQPYTSGGVSFWEPLDIIDARKGLALRSEGPLKVAGGMLEGIISPLMKVGMHVFGMRLPSDDIYNKYRTPGQMVTKDLSNYVPEKGTLGNITSMMEILGLSVSDSSEYLNTALGVDKQVQDALDKGDTKKADGLRKQFNFYIPLVDAAHDTDAQLKSRQSEFSQAKKDIKADDSLSKAEQAQQIKHETDVYQKDRSTLINDFNKQVQAQIKGPGQVQAFLGINPAEAATVSSAVDKAFINPPGATTTVNTPPPTNPKAPAPQNIVPAAVQTGKKLDQVAAGIARLEGWTSPGSPNIKRNNPGNLVYAGQPDAKPTNGSRFATFVSAASGWRALQKQIQLDARRGNTLTEFVNKFAPPAENNSAAYVRNLSTMAGIPVRAKLIDFINATSAYTTSAVGGKVNASSQVDKPSTTDNRFDRYKIAPLNVVQDQNQARITASSSFTTAPSYTGNRSSDTNVLPRRKVGTAEFDDLPRQLLTLI